MVEMAEKAATVLVARGFRILARAGKMDSMAAMAVQLIAGAMV